MTKTVRQAQHDAIAHGLDEIDAQVLLCFALGKPRSYLYTWPEAMITAEQEFAFEALVAERRLGVPVAYLTGEREFWSLPIKTSPATLIPRPDTERLVEVVLARIDNSAASVIDLGTGTGAIALALKSERPLWRVSGVDRVADAVLLAQQNASQLKLDVHFEVGDWLAGVSPQTFDVIVSNPPYIDADDSHLQQGDVRFEPKSALVAEANGLADIQHIITDSRRVLKRNGFLFFEHGWQQADAVRALFHEAGFVDACTEQDYAGNDRVTYAQWYG